MSWLGSATGRPSDGLSTLFDEIISSRASSWLSNESGTCTAIWSPSKSALNAAQTSGWMRIALPSTSTGSNAWMPRRCSVGARFSSTGWSSMISSRISYTSGDSFSTIFLARFTVSAMPFSTSLWMMNGLNSSTAIALGRPHWCSLQLRAHDDHRTARVVHALAEQVLAEPALLALEHVGQRLERPLAASANRLGAAAVVEQRVHRLLQHALLVAQDDLRRPVQDQLLQPVVAVDHAAIQIVQIRRGEPAAVQRHERPQVRRNHRDDVEDHPLRVVARLAGVARSCGTRPRS